LSNKLIGGVWIDKSKIGLHGGVDKRENMMQRIVSNAKELS